MAENEFRELLEKLDATLLFLGLVLLATGLSWRATAIQREELLCLASGREKQPFDVLPMRMVVSAITVGATVFFLALSLDSRRAAQNQGAAARCSADRNVCSSLLVLAASLVRLYDLILIRCLSSTQEEESVLE